MKQLTSIRFLLVGALVLGMYGCKSSKIVVRDEVNLLPSHIDGMSATDSTNSADITWKNVFSDLYLQRLIDSALVNNQELNMTLQELGIANSEVRAKRGEYLPVAGLKLGVGTEKPGEFTRDGAVEEQLHIDGKAFPEPLNDFMVGGFFSWELDIWKKLRNSKAATVSRYLATVEGKNFMLTNLVAEIASSYYELLALDNQLDIVNYNIGLQSEVLGVIKQQKSAARVSELAVNRFEAQLLNTKNLQFEIKQQITLAENKINFLVGRYPQPVERNKATFGSALLDDIYVGVPSQLLANRTDIRQAEQELIAAKLDVKSARANFYPNVSLNANIGFQAFNPSVWFNPSSILYNVMGDLVSPLINRNAINAAYAGSSARQLQAVYKYEQTILNAYVEVVNQLSGIDNYSKSYETKALEVDLLNRSVSIANQLYMSARADYMEVLLTQRETLESKMELVEIKMKEIHAKIATYKALGGGWK